MPCETVDLGGGAIVIACSRGRKKRAACDVCGRREHVALCDFKLSGAKAGQTCDRKLCRECAAHVGKNRDLCPPHAKLEQAEKARQLAIDLGRPAGRPR